MSGRERPPFWKASDRDEFERSALRARIEERLRGRSVPVVLRAATRDAIRLARALTPVEEEGGLLVKRDDLYRVANVRGGKVRACLSIATAPSRVEGLVTAGHRHSPQVNIVAQVARILGVPCRIHTPTGALLSEVASAVEAGADLHQHAFGRGTLLVSRAREDARRLGWVEIPFGMEQASAVTGTAAQVESIVEAIEQGRAERIVMPAGSGMSVAGVLHGVERLRLWERGLRSLLAVQVGPSPLRRIRAYAPSTFDDLLRAGKVRVIPSTSPYEEEAPEAHQRPAGWTFRLDPHYEAKCAPFLQAGDLLWVVGVRQEIGEANDREREERLRVSACSRPLRE